MKEEFGKSVLITDHNVPQTLKVCDRALIINDGQKIKEGTPREIINDPHVRSAYLGNTFKGDEFDAPMQGAVAPSTAPVTGFRAFPFRPPIR